MKRRCCIVLCLALAAVGLVAAGREPATVEATLARAERIRSPELDYAAEFRLEVTSPDTTWKQRSAVYSMIAHGKHHSLVLMREPASLYPGVLLIARGKYWLQLPRSSKPFQLSPRHVLNGDVAYGDLARGSLTDFYEARLDGEEEIDGRPCRRIELTRTNNLGMYARIVCWIDKKQWRYRKFAYYGGTGALMKTARYLDYRRTEIGARVMRIEVDNHIRPGERTVMTFENLRAFDSAGLSFERDAIAAFRDAARPDEGDETQRDVEQIRDRLRAGAGPQEPPR
ncbi:MAG: outer membrane lipoprotein-sorting protein [bacterium]|nr:outer membrane lipoprotein-sorting protein [bacterium]